MFAKSDHHPLIPWEVCWLTAPLTWSFQCSVWSMIHLPALRSYSDHLFFYSIAYFSVNLKVEGFQVVLSLWPIYVDGVDI
jgi:hypothetical protein